MLIKILIKQGLPTALFVTRQTRGPPSPPTSALKTKIYQDLITLLYLQDLTSECSWEHFALSSGPKACASMGAMVPLGFLLELKKQRLLFVPL